MRIAIASDHRGFLLKTRISKLLSEHHVLIDMGPNGLETTADYPDYAHKVAAAVANNKVDRGILICCTGIGMSMTANKTVGVRAALVHNWIEAETSRKHNNANVLCLGENTSNVDALVNRWLIAEFDERYKDRVNKIERSVKAK